MQIINPQYLINKMSKNIFLTILLINSLVSTSCSDDQKEQNIIPIFSEHEHIGNWIEGNEFNGVARTGAVSFIIGDIAYIGTGVEKNDCLNDFWSYDNTTNTWKEVTPFLGQARSNAVAFAVDGKGYVGTGINLDNASGERLLKDFYVFDPTITTVTEGVSTVGSWTKISDFPTARYSAIAFAVAGTGYVGTGDSEDNEQKDFWKYDVASDSWEIVNGFEGSKRLGAMTFVIDDKAYVLGGNKNNLLQNDVHSFDGTTWATLNDLDSDYDSDAVMRYNGTAFTLNGKAYVTLGTETSTWGYTPSTDSWNEERMFEGSSREQANSFSFSNKAFILLGNSGAYFFDDMWEYKP